MIWTDATLVVRQKAAAAVEKQMVEFMLQYGPARDLKVCDVQAIANYARVASFDAFTPEALDKINEG